MTLDHHFAFDGSDPDSVTVPFGPILGEVDAVTVTVFDRSHPGAETQPGERVTISLGTTAVGTTPDLPDGDQAATYVLAVGRYLETDSLSVAHSPSEVADSITVVSVCVTFAVAPPSTTTTIAPTTTTTVPVTTTTVPDGTTTSAPPPTNPPPTTTASPTTSAPPSSSVPPTNTVPSGGSFSATCAAVGSDDLASLVWTASGNLPTETVAGTPITLSDQEWSVSIPGSVLENATDLGLIEIGDSIPVVIGGTISASGTDEPTRSAHDLATSVVVTANTGGAVQPALARTPAPDMVFTPNSDAVAFRMSTASAALDLGLAEPVQLTCTFDEAQPPFVASPPAQVSPPPGELAFTGPSTYLWAAIIVLVLLDVGYLLWSASRPERRPLS
ncbi:MAG: hypothetical protein AAGC53_10815 [Actinomycetota bacterium]